MAFILVFNVLLVNKTSFSICEGVLGFGNEIFCETTSRVSDFVSLRKFIGETSLFLRYDERAFLI